MPFKDLLTDTISLLKNNGERIDNIQSSVQTNKIFIYRSDILIEPGDLIQRNMSNGGEETFQVIDPGFHEEFHDIPAGYQMRVKKLGLPEAKKAIQNITYNFNGNNTRVNNNSTDNSTNIVNLNKDVVEQITLLRQEINHLISSSEDKQSALEIVDAIEAQFQSTNPSKVVISTLIDTLPNLGSIASIGSFLISLLGS